VAATLGRSARASPRTSRDAVRLRERTRVRTVLAEAGFIVVCVLIVELFTRSFVVQLYVVPSASMENTMKVGDTVVVNRLSAEFGTPRRGEVIVFRDPGGWIAPDGRHKSGLDTDAVGVLVFLGLIPNPTSGDLVKRVIGLPGDTVRCDAAGRFTVNGATVAEPYLYPGDQSCSFPFQVTVPAGCLWVEGDHRSVSADSRYHRDVDDGAVPIIDVIGTVIAVA
jgi:signal peptidase I